MSVQNIAQAYLDGYYPATHGLALNDAIHVLASQYGVHKADLKVAIASAIPTPDAADEPVESPEAIDGSTTAVEGADVISDNVEFFKNFP